jgi:hypothetical protein
MLVMVQPSKAPAVVLVDRFDIVVDLHDLDLDGRTSPPILSTIPASAA